ncbi:phosphatase PAP2 family protein [Streptomyces cynarae]|uniref:phosphatase PAP2 family protein n=1 Tax=Streptomyces cynarae TaxID=2981134 RepID=UPI00406C80E2
MCARHMRLAGLRDADRSLSTWAASRIPHGVGTVLSAVEEIAESAKLWCGVADAMAWLGGGRGRKAAATGLAALTVAQLLSNGLCKQLADRPRSPKEWFPPRRGRRPPRLLLLLLPLSLGTPPLSGHTAAAVAFTTAITPTWPAAGAACALPAALERVQSGAHYPTQVAAGAAIGLASAWLTHRAPRLILRH